MLGERNCECVEEYVGELGGIFAGGICMDWDDERRKKGIEDGVRRFVEAPRLIDEEGLRGVC